MFYMRPQISLKYRYLFHYKMYILLSELGEFLKQFKNNSWLGHTLDHINNSYKVVFTTSIKIH